MDFLALEGVRTLGLFTLDGVTVVPKESLTAGTGVEVVLLVVGGGRSGIARSPSVAQVGDIDSSTFLIPCLPSTVRMAFLTMHILSAWLSNVDLVDDSSFCRLLGGSWSIEDMKVGFFF